ncbi:MAG TPA: glycosyltransferase family 4 protein, partial [Thermoplasmata archaeon]|nr:glycosyltransferase family 4 protein [Thermoplasmata archaeon]
YDADPNHGGFGARVDALVRMFAAFARVHVTLTDWFGGDRVPGVDYEEWPLRDTSLSRLHRLRTYYKTDFPKRPVTDRADLAVVETLDLWGLTKQSPGIPHILDEHNVYWELLRYDITSAPFFSTRLGRSRSVRRILGPYLLRRARDYEARAIRQAEATFVTSTADRECILRELPDRANHVHVLPNTVDAKRCTDFSGSEQADDVVFVGNFAYGPNREAARFIRERLAPGLPHVRFLLVGGNAPVGRDGPPNVIPTGFVRDLDTILGPAAVCVAPLAQGSGTRLKILTYLGSGKAVVASTKAVEGLDVRDGEHLLIRDDEAGFRAAILSLLKDPELRRSLGRNGRRLVEERYDWRVYVDWLRQFSATLRGA